MKYFLIFILGLLGAVGARKSYDGAQVFRVLAKDESQLQVLLNLRSSYEYSIEGAESPSAVNFWSEPAQGNPTDILIAKDAIPQIAAILAKNGIESSVLIKDVEVLIQNQLSLNHPSNDGKIGWDAYNRYDAVMEWLSELATTHSEVATLQTVGQSTENRDLVLVQVSTGGQPNKPIIFIDGNFHAREWISPAVVTYIINQLVTNTSAYSDILDHFDFHLLPMVNPDGYEYTHTADRMWRKTRSVISGSTCRGVDPNRNFNIDFGGCGSSSAPCAETYMGTGPFNIPETRFLSEYISSVSSRVKAYLSMHSYAQAWLTPYAYTPDLPPQYTDIMAVCNKAIAELETHFGTRYRCGPTNTVMYCHSGASQDWSKDVAGIKYTFTPELRDTGTYGFLLPPNQILPTSIETWAAIQVIAREIIPEL